MRRRPLALFALVTLVVSLSAIATAPAARVRSTIRMTTTETALLVEINRVRAEHGLVTLRVGPALQRAARSHTSEMLSSGSFAHGDFAGRMQRFGIRSFAGENLAWGFGSSGTAPQLVGAWLGSPGHRANLLRERFRRIGVGASIGSFSGYDGAVVVTADFSG